MAELTLAELQEELRARDRTIEVLMDAMANLQDRQGSALSLMLENAALERTVLRRTREVEGEREQLRSALSDLQATQVELLQAQKLSAIGELAGGIAHEINTPMQFVCDNMHFLNEAFKELLALAEGGPGPSGAAGDLDYFREEIPRAFEQTQEGVQRVITIVKAMKEFSHPSLGRKEASDLHACLDSTVTVTRNVWKYVAVIQRDYDLACPPVPVVRDEFNQVVLNLIVNAADAIADVTGKGAAGLGAITLRTLQRPGAVEVQVEDTGSGIPPEWASRIFEPFFTTKEVGKGSGQGLAIAYAIVVGKHGGQIGFEPLPQGGTRFWFRLPTAEGATLPPGPAPSQEA